MAVIFDTIIIGGGPAGYTAAMYAARAGLSVLVVEMLGPGGQMTQTTQIDNYPGFDQGVDGITLGFQMQSGAHRFGAQTRYAQVRQLELAGKIKKVHLADEVLECRTVILATGADHKHLGLPREQELVGKGVAYCATCDGMFYRGKTVAVVGGGNTAAAAASYLSRLAQKVYLIHRRDSLRATKLYHKALEETGNIEFLWNTTVEALEGEEKLSGLLLKNVQTGQQNVLPVDGVFVSIGNAPRTELVKDQLTLDAQGYICAGEDTHTSLRGVFAAGDVRTKPLRQVVTATADGAVAAQQAEAYLLETE